jgi:chromosome segregation ATPase
MNTVRRRGFFSSVSSVSLLSVFFIGGVSVTKNASASFADEAMRHVRKLAGVSSQPTGAFSSDFDKENVFGNAQKTSSHRKKTEKKKKEQEDLDETLKGTQTKLEEEMRKLGEKEQRIVALTEKVSNLEEELRLAQENRQSSEKDIADLRGKIEIANSNLRILEQRNQMLTKAAEEEKQKIQELTYTLHKQESEAQRQAQKIKDFQLELEKAKSEQRVASKEKALLKVKKEALEKELGETREKLAAAQTQLIQLELDLEDLRAKEQDVARTVFSFVGDLRLGEEMLAGVSLETVLDGVNLDLLLGNVTKELNTRSAAAESRRLVLEAEIAQLKRTSLEDKADMEAKERSFEGTLRAKEERIQQLSFSLSELEEKMSTADAQRLQLVEDLQEKERQLRHEKTNSARLEADINRLTQALKEAEELSKGLQQRIDVLQAEKEAAEATKATLSQLLELAKEAAAHDKETLGQEIAKLQQQITELQAHGKEERGALESQHREDVIALKRLHEERLKEARDDIEAKARAHKEAIHQLDEATKRALEEKNTYEAQLEAAEQALQKTREEAAERLASQQAQFAEDMAELGREHGLETQRLKEDHKRVVAETEEAVREIQKQIDQLTQLMTAEQAAKAAQIVNLQQALDMARDAAASQQQRHEEEMQQLGVRQKEAVQMLEERLQTTSAELASTHSLLKEAQASAMESATTFQSKIEELRFSLQQEEEKNKREWKQLHDAHAALLAARDQQHQEASAALESQLRQQASMISAKEKQLAENREVLDRNVQTIKSLQTNLGRKTRGLDRLKEERQGLLEAGLELMDQVDQLSGKLENSAAQIESLEARNRELIGIQQFLSAEIQALKLTEAEIVAKSTHERETHAQERAKLKSELEAALTSNKLLQTQLSTAHAILEEIGNDHARLDVSEFDMEGDEREVSPLSEELGLVEATPAPHHHPAAIATRRMMNLVRVLKNSQRGLEERLLDSQTLVSSLRKEQAAHDQTIDQMAAVREAQTAEMQQVAAIVQHQEATILDLKRDVKKQEESLKEFEKEHLVLNEQLLAQETRRDMLERRVQELESERHALQAGVDQLSLELAEEQTKAYRFKLAVENLNETLNSSRQTIGELQDEQEESMLEVLRKKQEAIRGQKEQYLEDLTELHTQLAAMRGQLKAAQEDIKYTRDFAELQVEQASDRARERIKEFEGKIAAVVEAIQQKERVIQEKEEELHRSQVQLDAAQTQLREQKEALSQLREDYKRLQGEYDDSEARVALLTEQLEDKKKDSESAARLLSMAQAQQKRAEAEAAKEKGTRQELLKELAAQRKILAEATNRQALLAQLEGSVEDLPQKVTAEGGTGPRTPVKAPPANAFKTPEAPRTAVKVSRTPGTGIKAVMSPRLQGLGAALTAQFGKVGSHNQYAAFNMVMRYLIDAGVVQSDPENPMDHIQARTPGSAIKARTPGLRVRNGGEYDDGSPSKFSKLVGGKTSAGTPVSFRQPLFEALGDQ